MEPLVGSGPVLRRLQPSWLLILVVGSFIMIVIRLPCKMVVRSICGYRSSTLASLALVHAAPASSCSKCSVFATKRNFTTSGGLRTEPRLLRRRPPSLPVGQPRKTVKGLGCGTAKTKVAAAPGSVRTQHRRASELLYATAHRSKPNFLRSPQR